MLSPNRGSHLYRIPNRQYIEGQLLNGGGICSDEGIQIHAAARQGIQVVKYGVALADRRVDKEGVQPDRYQDPTTMLSQPIWLKQNVKVSGTVNRNAPTRKGSSATTIPRLVRLGGWTMRMSSMMLSQPFSSVNNKLVIPRLA